MSQSSLSVIHHLRGVRMSNYTVGKIAADLISNTNAASEVNALVRVSPLPTVAQMNRLKGV